MPLAVESLNGSVPSIEAGTTRPEPATRKLGSVFIYSDSGEMYRNRGDIWEQIGGAIGDFLGSKPPTFVEADVTLVGGEQTVLADANAAPFTVTLASASGRAGQRTVIKKIDGTTNLLTIAAPTGETVEDRNYIETDTVGDAVEVESDGVEWRIVSSLTGVGGGTVDTRTGQPYPVSFDVSGVFAPNALNPLSIPSYDGSGEVVHPSVHYDPRGWNGYRYWMAMTPLPGSDSAFENPSILASNDGLSWEAPPGLTNPVEPAPATGYYSDTELVREGDTLHLIWRHTESGTERLYLRSSTDGVEWSAKVEILSVSDTAERLLSPGVAWDGERYAMYYVDSLPSPNPVKRRTADALVGPWSVPTTVTIPVPAGRDWWHLSLVRLNDLYVMAVDDVPLDAAGGGGDLYLATSRDGLSWEVGARAAVPRGGNQQWDNNIYRACLVPVQGASLSLGIYYSAHGAQGWKIGYTAAPLDRHTLDYRGVHEIYDTYLVALLASFKKLGPYVFGDAFDRANSATALGTSTSGDAWTAISGTLGIQSGEVYAPATGNNRSFVETGISEGRVEADFRGLPTSGEAWMFFRYADSANYLRFGVANGVLRFQRVAANAVAVSLIVSGTAPAEARLAAEYEGDEIRMFVDHRPLATVTDANFTTATKVGLQIPNLTTRVDDMTVRRL